MVSVIAALIADGWKVDRIDGRLCVCEPLTKDKLVAAGLRKRSRRERVTISKLARGLDKLWKHHEKQTTQPIGRIVKRAGDHPARKPKRAA